MIKYGFPDPKLYYHIKHISAIFKKKKNFSVSNVSWSLVEKWLQQPTWEADFAKILS